MRLCTRKFHSILDVSFISNKPLSAIRNPRRGFRTSKSLERRPAYRNANMEVATDYNSWSNERLIERVTQLENELKLKNARLEFIGTSNATIN